MRNGCCIGSWRDAVDCHISRWSPGLGKVPVTTLMRFLRYYEHSFVVDTKRFGACEHRVEMSYGVSGSLWLCLKFAQPQLLHWTRNPKGKRALALGLALAS